MRRIILLIIFLLFLLALEAQNPEKQFVYDIVNETEGYIELETDPGTGPVAYFIQLPEYTNTQLLIAQFKKVVDSNKDYSIIKPWHRSKINLLECFVSAGGDQSLILVTYLDHHNQITIITNPKHQKP